MVPHAYRRLLRGQVHLALGRVEGDLELVEEIAAEQAVAGAGAGKLVGPDGHAPHPGLAYLEGVDDDVVDAVRAGHADDGSRPDRSADRHPGRLQRTRADHRAVGAGVQQELDTELAV